MSSSTLLRGPVPAADRPSRGWVLEVVVALLALSVVVALAVGSARSSAAVEESYGVENEAVLAAFAEALEGVGSDATPLVESCLALARASDDLAAAPRPRERALVVAREDATRAASRAALSCATAANGESPSALLSAAAELNSAREAGAALAAVVSTTP